MTPWPFPSREAPRLAPMPPPRPGAGARLFQNALGYGYSAPAKAPTFDHPWRPMLSGDHISFRSGRINTFEPTIDRIPLRGDDKHPAPQLKLDQTLVNAAGESWVCVDVYPTDQGELTQDSKIELVQASSQSTSSHALTRGRKAICLILWTKGVPVQAIAAVHWNMTYLRVVPAPGGGSVKHFFL